MFVMLGLCRVVFGWMPLRTAWPRGCCVRDSADAWDSWDASWTN